MVTGKAEPAADDESGAALSSSVPVVEQPDRATTALRMATGSSRPARENGSRMKAP